MPAVRLAATLVALVTLGACMGPKVPHPLAGQSRYLCCNLFYERTKINDANYQRGTMVPFGTRVEIVEVRKNSVKFQPAGHPPLQLVLAHGRNLVTMDQYLDRMFLPDDPRTRLRAPAGKSAKEREKSRAASTRITEAIEHAQAVEGMSRGEVLMALGYPPPHRTPSLESPTWTYWANRWETFTVRFEGDRVASVQR